MTIISIHLHFIVPTVCLSVLYIAKSKIACRLCFQVYLYPPFDFFELIMCINFHVFILYFFFGSRFSQFFVFISDFNHGISSRIINQSRKVKNKFRKVLLMKNLVKLIYDNFLPELTLLLVRWFVVGKFHKELFLTSIVCLSRYMTLVTNTEQYNKGPKFI